MLSCAMSSNEPIGFTPAPVAAPDRALMRDVVLVYRRHRRAGSSELVSRDAAERRYLELRPESATDRLEASGRVGGMIANAVAVDPRWFWHGPDV